LPVDLTNNLVKPDAPVAVQPRLRLRDLVSSVDDEGQPDPNGQFFRSGASCIYREQGQRLIPIRIEVQGRQLEDIKAEVRSRIGPSLKAGYRVE
jgi:cobalt-zinc-cadmium resistance protein CzcA